MAETPASSRNDELGISPGAFERWFGFRRSGPRDDEDGSSEWFRRLLRRGAGLQTWLVRFGLVLTVAAASYGLGLDYGFMVSHLGTLFATIPLVIAMAIATIVAAVCAGALGALGRLSPRVVPYTIASLYVNLTRATPQILKLYLIYFGLPALHPALLLTPFQTAVIALGVGYGAYLAEVFRTSVRAIPRGQTEAAMAVGMTRLQLSRRIVLPQAIRLAIPPSANYFIFAIKDTSLVGFIGATELFSRALNLGYRHVKVTEMLITAALMYWAVVMIMSAGQRRLEWRLGRGYEKVRVGERTRQA